MSLALALAALATDAALSLPVPVAEPVEPASERVVRHTIIGAAVASVASEATCGDARGRVEGCRRIWPGSARELALLLVTQGWHETKLSRRLHEDKCLPHECDGGLAKSPWQLHANARLTQEIWETIGGVDYESTRLAAWHAAVHLAGDRARCADASGWLLGTIAGYTLGEECVWGGAAPRARTFYHLLTRFP